MNGLEETAWVTRHLRTKTLLQGSTAARIKVWIKALFKSRTLAVRLSLNLKKVDSKWEIILQNIRIFQKICLKIQVLYLFQMERQGKLMLRKKWLIGESQREIEECSRRIWILNMIKSKALWRSKRCWREKDPQCLISIREIIPGGH